LPEYRQNLYPKADSYRLGSKEWGRRQGLKQGVSPLGFSHLKEPFDRSVAAITL